MRHAPVLLAALCCTAGCTDRPSAPPITNSPVYQDEAGGFRVLAPEGWIMTSRSAPPPGPLARAALLVRYQSPFADQPGDFHVFAADIPADADIGQHIEKNPVGPDKFVQKGPPEAVTIGGAAAARYQFAKATTKPNAKPRVREILAFRRPDRVYLFCVTYDEGNGTVRDKIRTLLNGITWDK